MISGALFLGRDTHDPATDTAKRMCCASARRIRFLVGAATPLISLHFSPQPALLTVVFAIHHRTLSPVVPLHDRGIVSAHPAAASYCSKRNAARGTSSCLALVFTFLLPQLGALSLLCLSSPRVQHGHHHGNHVHLLLFSRSALPFILCGGYYLSRKELSAKAAP